jgi:tetratricopeptide (TPR) repeat protein
MNPKDKNKKSKQNLSSAKKTAVNFKYSCSNKWVWFGLGIILITLLAIYLKAIKFDLLRVWDDQVYISGNDHIKNLHWENIKLFFTSYYVNNYQPVTMLFYAIDYKIGAGHASLFHFNNILLHLLNTYLVFVLIKRISPKNIVVALITSAFFAVHPMHVESVVWVAERKDVLYTFFFLLSLIIYTYYLKSDRFKPLIITFIFFVLSCLSKSAAVILPLVLLLLDYYSNRKYNWKMIVEKLPFFAISIIFGLVAIQSQKGAVQDMAPNMSAIKHISVVSYSFLMYLFKAFIPVNLSAIYPYPKDLAGLLPIIYYLSILFVGLILFFVWYSLRVGKDIVFGFLFFVITIILVLQFVQVGAASMADRYTYVPYIGIFFIVGKLFEYLLNSNNINYQKYKNYLVTALVLGFISFSGISSARVGKWENDEILFSDAKSKFPSCDVPYFIIGDYYLANYIGNVGNNNTKGIYLNKSLTEYENALKLSLNRADKVKALYNLGTVKGYSGDFAGAINYYNETIKTDNNYTNAFINRGNAKRELKDYKGAIEDLNKAIALNPQSASAYINRGVTKYNSNDYKGAVEDFDMTIKFDINNTQAYNDRGSAKYMLKDYEGALQDYTEAVKLNPRYTEAISNKNMVKSIIENSKK